MHISKHLLCSLLSGLIFFCSGCSENDPLQEVRLINAFYGNNQLQLNGGTTPNVSVATSFSLVFSQAVVETSLGVISLESPAGGHNIIVNYKEENQSVTINPIGTLENGTNYILTLENLEAANGAVLPFTEVKFQTVPGDLTIESLTISGREVKTPFNDVRNVPTVLDLQIEFSSPIDLDQFEEKSIVVGRTIPRLVYKLAGDHKTVSISSQISLGHLERYDFEIEDDFQGSQGEPFDGFEMTFITSLDSTLKFPEIPDTELLTKVQEQTFKYFWDFGHPVSGLARERNTSGETVTIGGSGFGVMSIIVGIERGFITREEGVERLEKITTFLEDKAERFHGVWSHWLNGTTGEVRPFSANDDGADLVETAFMIQGLLTVRQYLDPADNQELAIIGTINRLWNEVEWTWFTQGGQDVLFWHWSPNFGWEKNLAIRGWNEAFIIYVLAASSTTHPIDKPVYDNGWARNGNIRNNGNTHFGYDLDLRNDMGGPLFFAHYSFLGLDPRNLEDQYANYWEQNVNHTLINRAYCIANPKRYLGYNEFSWGLTASDGNQGYSAHSPDNDRGVITPTAAIASIPYTPMESMEAIRFFYYILGDELWGQYGFYDAFNLTEGWYADSYIAIDQGPIICMIENYRTNRLWDLFMSAPEIKKGLSKLGFTNE
ncbi:MAG TPA: glucoamylase family protein [Cyclobacteriaceae bacterium]